MIQKYNYNNNVLPKEIERNIAHNIALLLNSPIEDFVRYHSLEKDDKRRCANYEWYERQYWLFMQTLMQIQDISFYLRF